MPWKKCSGNSRDDPSDILKRSVERKSCRYCHSGLQLKDKGNRLYENKVLWDQGFHPGSGDR